MENRTRKRMTTAKMTEPKRRAFTKASLMVDFRFPFELQQKVSTLIARGLEYVTPTGFKYRSFPPILPCPNP